VCIALLGRRLEVLDFGLELLILALGEGQLVLE
jgi:hypothetical protein